MKRMALILGVAAAIAIAPATAGAASPQVACPERAAGCEPVVSKPKVKLTTERTRSAIVQATDRNGRSVWRAGSHIME